MKPLTSTLRAHRKVIKNYFRYGDKDFDPVEYLALDEKKLLYIVISKVACTTIKATIGKNYGIKSTEILGQDIHSQAGWNRIFGKLNEPYSDYFKFTFVRNPFSRLVSCYNDRVVLKDSDRGKTSFHFQSYPFKISPNISFEDFVKIVVDIPDYLADRHFKSQSYSVFKNGNIKPDFIGKLESFSDDWSKLAELFDLPEKIESLNRGTAKSARPKVDFRTYYDTQLIDMVYKRYQEDVELFGYQDEYEDLRRFVSQ